MKLWWMVVALAACGVDPSVAQVGVLEQAVLDERWWKDPLFVGSTPYHFADGHTWYDSDVGGGYVTGSYVRLPIDANYVGDWNTGPVYCNGGGTSSFWSPIFEATVAGKTTRFAFNHLSKSFLGANGRTHGWYNGGALIGLTGGGTCDTGMPTFSSGPHFCNEMRDYDPYTFWNPVPDYGSNCQNSNGTSGVANPVCGGNNPADPCSHQFNGNGPYCGSTIQGDGNTLYSCLNSATSSSTKCPCGCMVNPGKPDTCVASCGPPDPCKNEFNGNGLYCGKTISGDPILLYNCQNHLTASTSKCSCGCTVNAGVNDACTSPCLPSDPCGHEFNGNGLYCGASITGDASKLYNCQNSVTASALVCPCGCTTNPGMNDQCTTCMAPPDLGTATTPDAAAAPDDLAAPVAGDAAADRVDGGFVGGHDASRGSDGGSGASVVGGCSVSRLSSSSPAPSPTGGLALLALALAAALLRRARRE